MPFVPELQHMNEKKIITMLNKNIYTPSSVSELAMTTETCVVQTTGDLRFSVVVDKNEADPLTQMFLRGEYPFSEIYELLTQIVSPPARVLDLGGHIGAFSLAAAAAGYEVVTVEASPRNAALLQASVEANHWENIRIINAGISDAPGTLTFVMDGPYGHVATVEEKKGQSNRQVSVPAITVDQLIAELGWTTPHFIKMDIEGSEVAALKGMKDLLAEDLVPPIYYESNGHTLNLYDKTPQDLKAAVEAYGYKNYLVLPNEFRLVHATDVQGTTVVDNLAVKTVLPSIAAQVNNTPFTSDELAAQLLQCLRDNSVPLQMYALRTLATAPTEIQLHPLLTERGKELTKSNDAEVQKAALLLVQKVQAQKSSWLSTLFGRR